MIKEVSDYIIIKKALSNKECFSALYDKYYDKIYRYVSWRISSQEDAEDIVSDVFFTALEKLSSYRLKKDATFNSWIYKIAVNKITDYYRAHGKKQSSDIEAIEESTMFIDTQFESAEKLYNFKLIRSAIESLPMREKEIINLKFFSDCSNREISTILGINEKNVSARLSRALKKLKKTFELQDIIKNQDLQSLNPIS